MMNPIKNITEFDATKAAFSFVDEFKKFAFKGNVIDLAVGVIIGAAFGKIVSSLVDHIIMPTVAIILPVSGNYKSWELVVDQKTIPYGLFLADVVNFLIVSFALFVFIVKFLGWVLRAKKEEAAAAPPLSKDQELLMEIRDLLKQERASAS
jgi:large conductance mechanosensitive channel